MKKSFLKRVAAAAVAVPVALTQTALFTSFAAGETADSEKVNTISVDTFLRITPATGVRPNGEEAFKKADTNKYLAKEVTADSYVQDSVWNEKLQSALNSYVGKTITLTKDEKATLARNLKSTGTFKGEGRLIEIAKRALLNDGNLDASISVNRKNVVITIDVDYGFMSYDIEQFANEYFQDKVGVDFKSDAVAKLPERIGTIVLTADTSKLDDNTLDAEAVVTADGEELNGADAIEAYGDSIANETVDAIKADAIATANAAIDEKQAIKDEKQAEKDAKADEVVEKQADVNAKQADLDAKLAEGASADEIADAQAKLADAQAKLADAQAKLDDAQAKLDDAQKKLDDARDMAEGKIDDLVNKYMDRYNSVKNRYDAFTASYDVTFEAADIDELIQKAEDEARARNNGRVAYLDKALDKAPETVEEAKALKRGRLYEKVDNVFVRALEIVNNRLSGNTIEITVDDLVDALESAYDVTASATVDKTEYTADGDILFYVPDEEKEEAIAVYTEYVNGILAEQNLEIDTCDTVKVVQAKGSVNAKDAFSAEGVLDIYRVFNYTTKKIVEDTTEPDTTEPTTTEPTTTEPTTTEPTTTEPTTTEPTTTEPTTTEPTTTEPTTTEPTTIETAPVKVEVDGDKGFFFSHDTNAFEIDALVSNAVVVSGEGSIDNTKFAFGMTAGKVDENLSPADVYNNTTDGDGNPQAYAWVPLYIFYDGKPVYNTDGEAVTAYVYIGVKGDANLDGQCNAVDASEVLIYSAAKGAGENYYLSSGSETFTAGTERLEQFTFFLADTNTESTVGETADATLDAADANNILVYSAFDGAGEVNWIPDVLDTPYPTYSEQIAIKAGLIK